MVTTYNLVKSSHLDSSLYRDCSTLVTAASFVCLGVDNFWRNLWRKEMETSGSTCACAGSDCCCIWACSSACHQESGKHWGLLLLWESDLENSREKEWRKTHPVSLFSYLFAFSNNVQDDYCFSLWNAASYCIKHKLQCCSDSRKMLFLLNYQNSFYVENWRLCMNYTRYEPGSVCWVCIPTAPCVWGAGIFYGFGAFRWAKSHIKCLDVVCPLMVVKDSFRHESTRLFKLLIRISRFM